MASRHIARGKRYPIITNAYVGASRVGTSTTPPPTVNFEDLGLVLKITPSVHSGGEMTLDVEAEYKVLGANANGHPDHFPAEIQGRCGCAGEWAVIAGLTQITDSHTIGRHCGTGQHPSSGPALPERQL